MDFDSYCANKESTYKVKRGMSVKNYYEILEVSSNASQDVIKIAYKTLVKRYHPDNTNDASINVFK